jgi:hypothetical protein
LNDEYQFAQDMSCGDTVSGDLTSGMTQTPGLWRCLLADENSLPSKGRDAWYRVEVPTTNTEITAQFYDHALSFESDTNRTDTLGGLAAVGNNQWLSVWESAGHEDYYGEDYDIFMTRRTVEVNSANLWKDFTSLLDNAHTDTRDDRHPNIGATTAGLAIVTWSKSESAAGGAEWNAWFTKTADRGDHWTTQTRMASGSNGDGYHDLFVTARPGQGSNWLAVMVSETTVTSPINKYLRFTRSTDNGDTWTSPTMISTSAITMDTTSVLPSVATDGQGRWIVTVNSDRLTTGGGTDQDVVCFRSLDDGQSWSDPIQVNDYATSSDVVGDYHPSVATDKQGSWVVTWSSQHLNGSVPQTLPDIYCARSVDSGATWSPSVRISSETTTGTIGDYRPNVAADGTGKFMLFWDAAGYTWSGIPPVQTTQSRALKIAKSFDNGLTWQSPENLASNIITPNSNPEYFANCLVTDGDVEWMMGHGRTISVTHSDFDILYISMATSGSIIGGVTGGSHINQSQAFVAIYRDNGCSEPAPGVSQCVRQLDGSVLEFSTVFEPNEKYYIWIGSNARTHDQELRVRCWDKLYY